MAGIMPTRDALKQRWRAGATDAATGLARRVWAKDGMNRFMPPLQRIPSIAQLTARLYIHGKTNAEQRFDVNDKVLIITSGTGWLRCHHRACNRTHLSAEANNPGIRRQPNIHSLNAIITYNARDDGGMTTHAWQYLVANSLATTFLTCWTTTSSTSTTNTSMAAHLPYALDHMALQHATSPAYSCRRKGQ